MKKILSSILILAMLLTASVCLFACNGDNEGGEGGEDNNEPVKVNYAVTVVDGDGNPIKGVKFTLIPKGATSIPDFPTDNEGKVTYKTDKELTVKVTEIPEAYEYDKLNVEQSFDSEGKLTVTLTKRAPFVIKVVDEDGNPVAGVKVQMCNSSGLCKIPVTTDENGEGFYDFQTGDFHAQLTLPIDEEMTEEEIAEAIANALPAGYTVTGDPKEYHDFEDGVATIILTKIAE